MGPAHRVALRAAQAARSTRRPSCRRSRTFCWEVGRHSGQAPWATAAATAVVLLLLALGIRSWVSRRHHALAQTDESELLELPLEVASKTSGGR